MTKKMFLRDYLGKYVITRNSISELFLNINNEDEHKFIFDFIGIEFISRSSADEYIKRKLNSDKVINEKNISSNVATMFYLVIKQAKLNKSSVIVN